MGGRPRGPVACAAGPRCFRNRHDRRAMQARSIDTAARRCQYASAGRVRAVRSRVRCSSCGFDSPEGARFCAGCGARLAQSCPACGCAVQADHQFCAACGHRLAAAPSPKTAEGERRQVTRAVLRPGRLHPPDPRARRRGGARSDRSLLQPRRWLDRAVRRHHRQAHRRLRHGGVRRAGRPRQRPGAGRPRRARDPRRHAGLEPRVRP